MKIDLVYLWVDGSDENWVAKKKTALGKNSEKLSASSAQANRWANHNELLFSLRSVEKFANWINHIFIVTDNQIPNWLNLANPKITIINHNEIIPNEKLPLFNSNAIEMFVWKIPNLSEYFLYANDDMFFGQPVKPDFFFDKNGNPIVIIKERNRKFNKLNDNSPVFHRLFTIKTARTIKFAYKKLGIKYNLTFKHAIEPIRKSYMEKNFRILEDDLLKTTITPFRNVNNIQRIIMPLFDNANGRNLLVLNWRASGKRIIYDYKKDSFFTRFFHDFLWLFATVFCFIKYDCYDKQWNLIRNIKIYKPTLFAINDFSTKKTVFNEEFMKKMFPNKSEFEK